MSVIAKTYNIAAQTCANYEYGSGKLSRFSTPVGYYQNGRHYYHITDYQGNVRCIVADNDSLVMAVHYYPGGSLFGETSGTWHNADLFQGGRIEKGYSHLFYDLQNRHYDPILIRFNSIDELCEKTFGVSPYIYGLGNPARYIDPNGLEPSAYEAALMSSLAYRDKSDENYLTDLRILENYGWYLIPDDKNTLNGVLFKRVKKDNSIEFAYAYPGTASLEDAQEDLLQIVGQSMQYSVAILEADIISQVLDNSELTFVGHSLGGGKAAAASMKTGRKAITYNPAFVSWRTKQQHKLTLKGEINNYVAYTYESNGRPVIADPVFLMQKSLGMKATGRVHRVYLKSHNEILKAHQIRTIINALEP